MKQGVLFGLLLLSTGTVALAGTYYVSTDGNDENPGSEAGPLRLHPDNPHYFQFRGEPVVLITSGEHYGAVINLDFDYVAYLEELARYGFNHTRLFTGTYREVPGSFGIAGNTLAPAPKGYAAPWARSNTPGYLDGGNKFDLTRWDEAYFKRLKDFVGQAAKRGIVVEVTLFCTMYSEELWKASPMHAANNINGIGRVGRYEVYGLKEDEAGQLGDEGWRSHRGPGLGTDRAGSSLCDLPGGTRPRSTDPRIARWRVSK